MELVADTAGFAVVSLGSEEALILMQPGEMLRRVLDRSPEWAEGSRFLTNEAGGEGMLAILPIRAVPALLEAPARHRVERDFKEMLFEFLADGEGPFPSSR